MLTILLFIHSSNIYYVPNYCVPGTLISIRHLAVKKKARKPVLLGRVHTFTSIGSILHQSHELQIPFMLNDKSVLKLTLFIPMYLFLLQIPEELYANVPS